VNVEMPGEWTGWPELPEGLECDQCDQSFGVGDDVWVIDADHPPGAVAHICLDCAEKFLYRLQREAPRRCCPEWPRRSTWCSTVPERELSLDGDHSAGSGDEDATGGRTVRWWATT